MSIKWVEGAPRFLQGNYVPTSNESDASKSAYDLGVLQFFWDRLNQNLYWLKFMDENNVQTWGAYPVDLDSIGIISILMLIVPLDDNYTRWAVADYDPTPSENIADKFFNGQYGLLWWTKLGAEDSKLFKMTAYEPNPDGGYIQTWTQIV